MSWAWTVGGGWLLPGALGGGLVLLLAWVLAQVVRQPARRQRLGEWGVAAGLLAVALSFAPAWLHVSVPAESAAAPVTAAPVPEEAAMATDGPAATEVPSEGLGWTWLPPATDDAQQMDVAPSPPKASAPPEPGSVSPPAEAAPSVQAVPISADWKWPAVRDVVGWLGLAHAAVAVVLLARWLLGHVGLWRLLRRAGPVPDQVVRRCAALVPGGRLPRLLCSPRLRVPLSCGLLRPTVVLPAALCAQPDKPGLRWVLIHELTHLQRRDAWACLLFGLGQVVFFFLPWFWWLRRQVRLCQEYVADAAAAEDAPADYAQFLLSLTPTPLPVPAGAVSVLGHTSDLYRRVTMLLRTPLSAGGRPGRLWSLGVAGSLLPLAVLVAGLGLRADAAPGPQTESPKPVVKKEEPKKEEKKQEEKKGAREAFDDFFPPGFPQDFDPEKLQKEMLQRVQKMMEEMQKRMGARGFPGLPPDFDPFDRDDRFPFGQPGRRPEGRLGVRVEKPSDALADQLDLPKGQGVVINKVNPDSAADKAGLKANDILLEIDGKVVPDDPAELAKLVKEIKANTPVDVTVLRKGKRETIKGVTLPEAKKPERPAFPGFEFPDFRAIPPAGFFGGQGVMTSVIRNNDRVTARHQEGNLVITVTGTVVEGKAKVGEITVQDGGTSNKYDSVEKVPEQYRDKVRNLIEMSEKGSVKIEIKGQ